MPDGVLSIVENTRLIVMYRQKQMLAVTEQKTKRKIENNDALLSYQVTS